MRRSSSKGAAGLVAVMSLGIPVLPALAQEELADRLRQAIPADTVTDAWSAEVNGFVVQSYQARELGEELQPTGQTMALFYVDAERMFQVAVEKGRENMSLGGGIGVFHRESGRPMLTAGDRSGDGRIDVLTLKVLDDSGNPMLDLVDYEADGQWDMRVNLQEGYFEIWHIDRWYRPETRDGHRGVVIDGNFVELERGDNRWKIP
jgi:hypothetical protein